MDLSAEKLCKIFEGLRSQRGNFDTYYQDLNDYFYTEAQDITKQKSQGQELEAFYMLDSTPANASDVLAAGLSNFLTPQSSKWLYLEHPNNAIKDSKPVIEWMQEVTDTVLLYLSRSNFYSEMPMFYKDSGVYGTASIYCEKDPEDAIRFYSVPIKLLYGSEDEKGRPSQYFIKYEFTAEQAMSKFGEECSNDIKEAYKAGKDAVKFPFICYFGKRFDRELGKKDKKNKPVRMVWIDEKAKKIMLEDGFDTMPIVTHRFFKRPQQFYGYSPAMKALPFARILFNMTETVLRAAQNAVAPATAEPIDFFVGTPNYNPFGRNFYNYDNGVDAKNAIFPLTGGGQLQVGLAEIEIYQKQIEKMMYNDVFLAFSGLEGGQRTVPEVMERISEKMVLLGPAVQRYMSDVLQPLLERVIFVLFEQNLLPQLPEEMMQDPSFEVKFVGRLVQNQRQAEITNIINSIGIAGQLAAINPSVLDKVNVDKAIDKVFEINNTDAQILRSDEEVMEMRQAQQEQQQAQMALMATQQVADIEKTSSEAEKNVRQDES